MNSIDGFTGRQGPYKEQIQRRREQNAALLTSMDDQNERIYNLEKLTSGKADKATTLSGYGITDAYTKTEADNKLKTKADKATTLSGYGITDAYTKTEIDNNFAALPRMYLDKGSAYLSDTASDSNGNIILDSGGKTIDTRVKISGDNNSEALIRAVEDYLAEFERRVYALFRKAILDSDFKF